MYSFKINNKKSLAIGIVFVCIFIALTVRLYVLMIHPTSTVQGELKNHQVEYTVTIIIKSLILWRKSY